LGCADRRSVAIRRAKGASSDDKPYCNMANDQPIEQRR